MGYSHSNDNRSLNLGGNGSVVLHPEGVTFSRMLGSSVAVVSAPGAVGTNVMNGNIQIDERGYAVVPYLSDYQTNSIGLDPSTLPDDVDLTQSNINVYPTKGAVVMAKFDTKVGYQAMVTLLQNNTPVPFGTLVTVDTPSAKEINTRIVGDEGQVYLSGLPEQGVLKVKWGKEANQQCLADFSLSNVVPAENNSIRTFTAQCR